MRERKHGNEEERREKKDKRNMGREMGRGELLWLVESKEEAGVCDLCEEKIKWRG